MLTDRREQIRQLKAQIYNAKIASKHEIFVNQDLVEEAVKQAKEGVSVHLSNVKPIAGTSILETSPAYNPVDGRPVTRVTHDALEIFEAAFTTRKNEKDQERKRKQELEQKAELDWFRFDNGRSVSDRYDVSMGGYITREYFMKNLYRCPTNSSCRKRFPDEEAAKKHGYIHLVKQR